MAIQKYYVPLYHQYFTARPQFLTVAGNYQLANTTGERGSIQYMDIKMNKWNSKRADITGSKT